MFHKGGHVGRAQSTTTCAAAGRFFSRGDPPWSVERGGGGGVGVNTLQAKMQCVTRSLSVYTSNGTGGGSAVELLTLS